MMKVSACLIFVVCLIFSSAGFANAVGEADWQYVVLKNDSFERIYQKYLLKRANISALSQHNQHKITKKLQPGQVLSIPVAMLKKTPTTAQVLVATGDVSVMDASGNNKRKLNQGDVLSAGMVIGTAKNSLAKLRFADDSIADIQSNSTLSIQTSFMYVGKGTYVTQLKLSQGRTELAANPNHVIGNSLQVETPSAVAAVRGTQFRVGAEGDVALQETLEGQVAFNAAGEEVLLNKGFGTLAERGRAPLSPIALPEAPDVTAFAKQIDRLPVEFDVVPQQGAVAWVSQLALDENFNQIVSEQITQLDKSDQPNQLAWSDLADGQYYLRLRAQEIHGLQGKDAIHAFKVAVPPPPPELPKPVVFELLQPLDGAVIPLAPTALSWISIPEADSYAVQIARDTNFESQVFTFPAATNHLSLNYSFGSGEYYWRVVALSEGKPLKTTTYRKFSR